MKTLKATCLLLVVILLSSCEAGIKGGSDLSRNHINYIKSLGILSGNERIILFDSQGRVKVSGNFFTDKRIAAYWVDDRNNDRSFIKSAFYKEIDSIAPHLLMGSTYSSYLQVYKKNGEKFKVYVAADSLETKSFFDLAIAQWHKNK